MNKMPVALFVALALGRPPSNFTPPVQHKRHTDSKLRHVIGYVATPSNAHPGALSAKVSAYRQYKAATAPRHITRANSQKGS
jgi:hypothetical protein